MAVDLKLNEMVDDLERLEKISVNDVELSYRTSRALKFNHIDNMAQAFDALHNGKLAKIKGIGRKSVNELREVLANVTEMTRPDPVLVALRSQLTNANAKIERHEACMTSLRVSFGETLENERRIAALAAEDAKRRYAELDRAYSAEKARHAELRRRISRLLGVLTVEQLAEIGIKVSIDLVEEKEA